MVPSKSPAGSSDGKSQTQPVTEKEKSQSLEPLRHGNSRYTPPGMDEEAAAAVRSISPRPAKSARDAREKAAKAPDHHSEAFTNYHDPSRQNARRHNTARADTFHTPSKLERDQPSFTEKKRGLVGDMPFNDLLWICEQSFRKEAATLGKEVLAIARAEFTNVTDMLLRDVRQPVETLSGQIVGKIGTILQEVEATSKVDWSPAMSEFNSQRDQMRLLQLHLSEEIARVASEVKELQRHQEEASDLLRTNIQQARDEIRDLQLEVMRRSERQVTQVLNVQQCLSTECAQVSRGVQDLQQEVQLANAELLPRVEAQLCRHVHELPVNVDFGQVFSRLGKSQEMMDKDLKQVIKEIVSVKSDLHFNDLFQKFEDQQRAVSSRLEQLAVENREHCGSLRDSGAQTDPPPVTDRSAQTEGKVVVAKKKTTDDRDRTGERLDREKEELDKQRQKELNLKLFENGEALKKKVRQALMKPQYNVTAFYRDTGWAQALAKDWKFEYLTFSVILMNAVWIAIDIDNNEAAFLINADPIFQIVENAFCVYFTFEVCVRFLAFRSKKDCLRDLWFTFDAALVAYMIVETWVSYLIFAIADPGAGSGSLNVDFIRTIRIIKMLRLSRMARLLRAIPELLVLLKAVGTAVRSMMVFFLLWLVVIYVFAVIFRQITEGQDVGKRYFDGVLPAMNTLLMEGILPENTKIMNSLLDENFVYWPLMMSFILLTSITLMYMLIGVLTDVVHLVAKSEQEGLVVTAVASRLRKVMKAMGRDEEVPLSKMEFQDLLLESEVVRLCQDVGVNVAVLLDMSDVIFESVERSNTETGASGIPFEGLVEVFLNMRGTNPATVKDVKEQLRAIKGMVREATSGIAVQFGREFREVNQQLQELRGLLNDEEDGLEVRTRATVTATGTGVDSPTTLG